MKSLLLISLAALLLVLPVARVEASGWKRFSDKIHSPDMQKKLNEELKQMNTENIQLPIDTTSKGKANKKDDEDTLWFLLHDTDSSGSLDGYELLLALNDGLQEKEKMSFKEAVEVVDEILETGDWDGDGYLDFKEFESQQEFESTGMAGGW